MDSNPSKGEVILIQIWISCLELKTRSEFKLITYYLHVRYLIRIQQYAYVSYLTAHNRPNKLDLSDLQHPTNLRANR